MRSPRPQLALLAAVLLLGAGCADGGTDTLQPPPTSTTEADPPLPDPPRRSDPPTSEPAPSPTPSSLPVARPNWDHAGPVGATLIGRAGGRYIVASDGQVAGIDRAGEVVWEHRAGGRSDDAPLVVDDVVLVVRDNPRDRSWPGTDHLQARDARTGELLWEDDQSFPTGFEGTVFTSACTGDQDRMIGDCTLSARDPRTGATRWAVPTYASVMVRGVVGDAVVVEGHPEGANPHLQLRSLATGSALSAGLENENYLTLESTGFFDVVQPRGRQTCRSTVRALDLDGEERWTRTFTYPRNPDLDDCEDFFAESASPGGPVVTSRYSGDDHVLDPLTGRELVRAGRDRHVRVVAGGLAVVEDAEGGARAVRVGSGRTAWTLGPGSFDTTWVDAGPLLLRSIIELDPEESRTQVLDRRTGEVLSTLPGGYELGGNGWVVTSSDPDGYGPATLRSFRVPGAEPAPPASTLDY